MNDKILLIAIFVISLILAIMKIDDFKKGEYTSNIILNDGNMIFMMLCFIGLMVMAFASTIQVKLVMYFIVCVIYGGVDSVLSYKEYILKKDKRYIIKILINSLFSVVALVFFIVNNFFVRFM